MQYKYIWLFILLIKLTFVHNALKAQEIAEKKVVLQPFLASFLAVNSPYKEMGQFFYGGGTYAYYKISSSFSFGLVVEYSKFHNKVVSEDFIKIKYPKLSLLSYGLSASQQHKSGVFLQLSGGYTSWLSDGASSALFVSPSIGFTKNGYGITASVNTHFKESKFNNTLGSVGLKLFKKINI